MSNKASLFQYKCLKCKKDFISINNPRRYCGCAGSMNSRDSAHYHFRKCFFNKKKRFQDPIYQYIRLHHTEHIGGEMGKKTHNPRDLSFEKYMNCRRQRFQDPKTQYFRLYNDEHIAPKKYSHGTAPYNTARL